jgi:hypothetical protein
MRLAKRHQFGKHFFLAQVGVGLTQPFELSHDLWALHWGSDLFGTFTGGLEGCAIVASLPEGFAPSVQGAFAKPEGMHGTGKSEVLPMTQDF